MTTFTRLAYESDSVGVIGLVLSDDYANATSDEPTAPVTSSLTAYASGSRDRNGIHARGVVITRTRGMAPDEFTQSVFLPLLTPGAFQTPEFMPGATVTLGNNNFTVLRQVPEIAM